MEFNILSWWHRRRVQAEVERPGRQVQTYRVTNPYHAVSVKAGPSCRQTAQAHAGRRYLSREAPPIPLPTCDRNSCSCRYVHHDDRRQKDDRRHRDVWNPAAQVAKGGERRRGRGRRSTDH